MIYGQITTITTVLNIVTKQHVCHHQLFLSDPGKPGVRSMGPDVRPRPCADLTDVTLADEDTNSILTDNANRAIQGNVAMQ